MDGRQSLAHTKETQNAYSRYSTARASRGRGGPRRRAIGSFTPGLRRDLVQRIGSDATTLAGMYVLRHGSHFGEVRFYSGIEIGETNMIGPNTAQQSLIAAATQELALIKNEDYGNIVGSI